MSQKRSFEDLKVGERFDAGTYPMTEAEIFEFARTFDPQPFHLDRAAARASPLGDLCASGWHTAAAQMRVMWDGWVQSVDGLGSPGIPSLNWSSPMMVDRTLHVVGEITELRPSRSRPDIGLAQLQLTADDGCGNDVCRSVWWVMIGRRSPGPETPVSKPGTKRATDPVPDRAAAQPIDERMVFLDTCPVGETAYLGSDSVSEADIIEFAHRYDPQFFHVDVAAATASHFGGLIASGWHTCGLWMRLNVTARDGIVNGLPEASRAAAVESAGVGIGFEDLSWARPMRPGVELHSFMTPVSKRESKSRPGWGLVRFRAELVDAAGELVLRFFPLMLLRNRVG